MPAFGEWPEEAAIVSRVLACYGEHEFTLAVALGRALGDVRKGLRVFFRSRGETARIGLADLLTRDAMQAAGLKDQFADTIGGMRVCVQFRNMFAHCHWGSLKHGLASDGLFFVSLDRAAQSGSTIRYEWQHASMPWLQQVEAYFDYTARCLWHVEDKLGSFLGRPASQAFPMPAKRKPPPTTMAASPQAKALLPAEY